MSKKDDKRGQIPRKRDLSITEQDALIQRWRLRKDLRSANPEIVGAMMLWVLDTYDIEQFVAKSHKAHFILNPKEDLISRMRANGFTAVEILKATENGDVAADWMTAEELASVVEKIAAMKRYFETDDPGTFAQALAVYNALRLLARRTFIQ